MIYKEKALADLYRRRAIWTLVGLAAISSTTGMGFVRANAQTSATTKQKSQAKKKASKPTAMKAQAKPSTPPSRAVAPSLQIKPVLPPGFPPGPGRLPGPGGAATPPPPLGNEAQPPPISPFPHRRGDGEGTSLAGTTFSFDFRGADVNNVLKFYSQMSGSTITTDAGLTGNVTIICPKPVTLDEAFKILQSVLGTRGFTALQDKNVITILPLNRAIADTTRLSSSPESNKQLDPRNQVMTQVIPVQNVDADTMAKELAPLISQGASLIGSPGTNSLILTDYASNVQRFLELVDALDQVSTSTDIKIYPLKRAEASAVADIITNLYSLLTTRGKSSGPAQGQPGFQPPPQPGQPGQATSGRPAVIAVPDTRTNSVIVVASPENQDKIATTIIGRLDDDDSNALDTKIRKIKFGNAVDVANLVNTALSNGHGGATGSSGSSSPFQGRAFGGGFGGFFGGFGGQNQNQNSGQTVTSTDPFGKVAADPRTNSLLITASPDRMVKIDDLIDKLDVAVPTETTTFVIPLKNAQASDVAYALSQAFGTNNNNNLGNFNTFNIQGGNLGNSHTPITRRLGAQSNPLGRGIRLNGQSQPPGPPPAPDGGTAGDGTIGQGDALAAPQGIQGVMTDNGFVPTLGTDSNADPNIKSRQFFGFGRQQSQGVGQSSSPQYGRGRTGGYANLLQLQNNVFVTASPNGDSIIVTTTPDNYNAVKDIVDALDVVQRQVMIQVIIAEVTLDQDEKMGFTLNTSFSSLFGQTNPAQFTTNLPAAGFGTTSSSTATGSQFTVSADKYSLLVQALTSDNKVRILSTPSVFTSNNEQAEIDITERVPYITSQSTGSLTTTVASTVQFQPVGFTLNVTPRITRNGLVTIDVIQEASDLLNILTLGTGTSSIQAPETNDRYADTEVTAQDGETIVLGGLIREQVATNINKIPLLSEVPLIGQFFRSHEKIRNKVELMVFLTPHVVNNSQEAQELAQRQGSVVVKQLPQLARQQPNLVPTVKVKKIKGRPNGTGMPQPTTSPTDPTTGQNAPTTPNQDAAAGNGSPR